MDNYQAASKRGETGDLWGAGNSSWPSVRYSQLYQTLAKPSPTMTLKSTWRAMGQGVSESFLQTSSAFPRAQALQPAPDKGAHWELGG